MICGSAPDVAAVFVEEFVAFIDEGVVEGDSVVSGVASGGAVFGDLIGFDENAEVGNGVGVVVEAVLKPTCLGEVVGLTVGVGEFVDLAW